MNSRCLSASDNVREMLRIPNGALSPLNLFPTLVGMAVCWSERLIEVIRTSCFGGIQHAFIAKRGMLSLVEPKVFAEYTFSSRWTVDEYPWN